MKRMVMVLAVLSLVFSISCAKVIDYTIKTTEWEMNMAKSVLGSKDAKKDPIVLDSKDAKKDPIVLDSKDAKKDPIAGVSCKIKSSCSSANVRKEPSTKSLIIATLKGGTSVTTIGQESSGWVKIMIDKKEGWVSNSLIE